MAVTAIGQLVAKLQSIAEQQQQHDQALQEVTDELVALQSIYGDENISLLSVQRNGNGRIQAAAEEIDDMDLVSRQEADRWQPDQPIRLSLTIPLDLPYSSNANDADVDAQGPAMRLAAILPAGYPTSSSSLPQLQLLSRYIGSHGVDFTIFGQVLRIYRRRDSTPDSPSSSSESTKGVPSSAHVDFVPGNVAIFDGIEKARELIEAWYMKREAERMQREESSNRVHNMRNQTDEIADKVAALDVAEEKTEDSRSHNTNFSQVTPTLAVHLTSSAALVERKSTFVGHAAPLHDPGDVPAILSNLLQDRRIARATHPAISAWVCKTSDGVVHRDCDDDGETAAGGRLAHLLDLLQLTNVIVIVTRWYGGVMLGPDRFKLINRAARDALDSAGLIETAAAAGSAGKASSHSKSSKNPRHDT